MPDVHPHIQVLLDCIQLEEKEQIQRYSLDQQHTLRSLKAEGLALHPLIVTRKSFGYADYPEVSFKLNFPPEANHFRDGAAIECFMQGEEPIKGVLLNLNGKQGEFRLFAPDFPDWIVDNGMGIKLAPDQRTTLLMKNGLKAISSNQKLLSLFEQLHNDNATVHTQTNFTPLTLNYKNKNLNESQHNAIQAIVQNKDMVIVHGPPGTGKTTTLIEAIIQLIKNGEKIMVAAPSNTAVDNIAKGLLRYHVKLLRVGNIGKTDEAIFPYTPEGKLQSSTAQKEIKALKIRAEQFRKMALKYKRSFGKAEREQRNLLFKEVRTIRDDIKKLQVYNEEKLYTDANVIIGTPVGLVDAQLKKIPIHTLVIDEAGQCLEPLAWCIFPLAEKIVLAGDHLQLPPTVLSQQAMQKGFNKSILERAIYKIPSIFLLNIQYRMRQQIAQFSSNYFYNSLLQTATHLSNVHTHIYFMDTAGSGNAEKGGNDGTSLQNEGELLFAQKIIETENIDVDHCAFISPYAGQVSAAAAYLPSTMRMSTIDSFQGQEKDIVILSLVRSNDEGTIGFLKDYRRMNVAITRAKEKLYIIGDSATIGQDNFYQQLLTYIEQNGCYKTIWEYELI